MDKSLTLAKSKLSAAKNRQFESRRLIDEHNVKINCAYAEISALESIISMMEKEMEIQKNITVDQIKHG